MGAPALSPPDRALQLTAPRPAARLRGVPSEMRREYRVNVQNTPNTSESSASAKDGRSA